jgi:hypothetical protein
VQIAQQVCCRQIAKAAWLYGEAGNALTAQLAAYFHSKQLNWSTAKNCSKHLESVHTALLATFLSVQTAWVVHC